RRRCRDAAPDELAVQAPRLIRHKQQASAHKLRRAGGFFVCISARKMERWMIEIALVRHGETDWNRQGRMQGHRDIPLNERGLEQAARLARRLRREPGLSRWNLVASSDLQRAFMTAACLAEAVGIAHIVRDP